MASATYNGRTFYTGDTIYFTKYWQNSYSTAAAGVYSGKYSFYATINDLIATGNDRTHNIKFTSLHNTVGTITSGGGYCTPTEITKGYKVTVTYDKNGGSSGTASQFGYVGASLTGTASRTGYTFAGWYTASSSGSKVTTIPQNATKYYAHWTANKYTVTLNNQSATTAGTGSVSATYGSAMPGITKPTKTGWTFGGYYTSTGGGGTQYYTAAGASARAWNVASNTTLYANWTANQYTVHFDGNGATSGSMSDVQYTYQTTSALPSNGFSRGQAFLFTGWNTQPNGTGTSVAADYSDSTLSSIDGDTVTLYAQWDLQYLSPSISNVKALRYENGAETGDGTCVHVEFAWEVDTTGVQGGNYAKSVKIQYRQQGTSTWSTLQNQTYSGQTQASVGGSVNYTSSTGTALADNTYDILISVTDYYGTDVLNPPITAPQATAATFLSSAFFTMDFSAGDPSATPPVPGGRGIGVGTPAPQTGLKVAMDTEFDNDAEFMSNVDATIQYDDSNDEYFNGLNDEALLSPNTISKIENALGLPLSTWDYDPWWADPQSPISLQNVLDFMDEVRAFMVDRSAGWKHAGTTAAGSTDTITIPNDAVEVMCVLGNGTNTYRASSVVTSTSSRWMIGGYWAGSNDWGYGNVNVTNSGRTYQRRNCYYAGQAVNTSAVLSVYYK